MKPLHHRYRHIDRSFYQKYILTEAIKSSPTDEEAKAIRKQINKRNYVGDATIPAKKLRLDQVASRRQEDETKLMNRSYNRAQIPDASNISVSKAKPPPQFTKDLPISSIRKTDQIKLVLAELETRYGDEVLAAMGVEKMKIRELKEAMRDFEDSALCNCPLGNTLGPKCKCKKAET
mmetsp:Transcript_21615/g.51013  ORF Transcript_21615/g.51013 Transcript_21615/m.51013 type:complete len:177 (-) Transcript_21615:442-972(-)